MTNLKLNLSLVCIIALTAVSCGVQKQDGAAKKQSSSLLWKISGKDMAAPSYLFGTIHMICPDKFLWTPAMQQAFEASDQLVLEMDLSNPQVLMKARMGLMLPQGKQLKDFFSPDDYKQLMTYATDSLGVPGAVLSRLKPFALMSMIMAKSIPCDQTPTAYEKKLMAWAKKDSISITGLETAEDQLAVVNAMDNDSVAQQLVKMLNTPKKQDAQYHELIAAYTQQDLNKLYDIMISAPDKQLDLNTMLFERNKNWIPKIEKLVHEKPTFIAVGAGHLAGPKGVIRLLKKEGYTVEPVR